MTIRFRTIALLAVLCIATIGCQKENTSMSDQGIQQFNTTHVMVYYIDGVACQTTLRNDSEYSCFVREMASLAKKGHHVHFQETTVSNSIPTSKEAVIYVTNNEDDAIAWCLKKSKEGYDVQMEFDPHTGFFTCTATKPDGNNTYSDTLYNKSYF